MKTFAIPDALAQACAHHVAGQLDVAERMYRDILQADPGNWDALQLLGTLLGQRGLHAQAVESLSAALRVRADEPTVHANLGAAYFGLGNYLEALACYERALRLKPDYAEAHYGMGLVRQAQGMPDEAAASYRRALQAKPEYVDAIIHLGNVLVAKGEPGEAVLYYQRALRIKPDHVQALYNLGTTELALGHLNEAAACFQHAVRLQPNHVQAHANLGLVWKVLGRLDEAAASLEQALRLHPNLAAAHNTLGMVWQTRGLLDDALNCLQRAVALEPGFAEAHNNLGHVLKDAGRLTEALASFRRAVELKPDFAEADSNVLNTIHFCPDYDNAAIYEEHRRWNRQHAQPLARFIRPYDNERAPERRLRIGYVSPDFRDHCQTFFTAPLVSCHDHANFEISCYADVRAPDEATRRLQTYADRWRSLAGLADEQVAELIRQDKIDILIDLTMHMARSRLLVFARKPAPVQACWLAYPGTTGLETMDYRLTDPYLDPPDQDVSHYAEESIRLPETFWCYDPQSAEPGVGPLPALTNGYITFGCLNNFCKVNDKVLTLWARVLCALPRSRLLLLAREGSQRRATLDFLERHGVTVDRVGFVSFLPRMQYLAMYHQIDIGLDTLPYNGHTTSLDSLWMGVPVVTLAGRTVVGRAGVSQLSNLGMRELIADAPEKWVNMVVELAHDLPRLEELRATLRERMRNSSLMDAPRFARNVEAAYRQIWRRWCAYEDCATKAANECGTP